MDRPELQHAGLLLMNIITLTLALKTTKKKKTWSKKWILRSKELGCFDNLMRELAFEDPDGYRRYMRMDTAAFEIILNLVSDRISKKDTVLREAIPAAERLALTLRFLATGETQSSLHFQFRIGVSTICGIVMEVCSAIYSALQPEVLKCPCTPEEWQDIADSF